MSDDPDHSASNARRVWLLAELLQGRALRTAEAARELGVSRRTVERDLNRIGQFFELETFRSGGLRYVSLEPGSVRVAPSVYQSPE